LKIALVLDHFDGHRGGLEGYCRDLALWLVARGHEVHAIAFGFGSSFPADLHGHQLEAGRSPADRAAKAERFLRTLAPDIVHDTGVGWYFDVLQPHFGTRRTARQRALAAESPLRRARAVFSVAKRRRYRELLAVEKRQHASPRGVFVAVSGMVRDDLERHGIDPSRLHAIFNGVDLGRFHPGLRETMGKAVREQLKLGEEPLFLFVAHNGLLKGVATVIGAARRLAAQKTSFHVAIVGRAGDAACREAVKGAGLERRISVCGVAENPEAYFAAADALVHPTFYDSCSLVVLEAMASGIPVITSRCNGAAEIIQQDREGWVIDDPKDDRAVAALMAKLCGDASLGRRMGQNARRVAEEHDSETTFAAIEALYRNIPGDLRRQKWGGQPV
jgi:UDP-glucose:(heptosyl)LPS alpha-1,3-glucosyltransferase